MSKFYDENLDESLTASVRRDTKQAKLARLSAGMAMQIAKRQNPAMYNKYMKIKKLYKKMKMDMLRKYGMKGKQAARKAIRK